MGDLDGDGDLDAFVANGGQANRIWMNDAGQFTDSGQLVGLYSSVAVSLGDLDQDGDLDIVAGSRGEARILWLENLGDGAFESPARTSVPRSVFSNATCPVNRSSPSFSKI